MTFLSNRIIEALASETIAITQKYRELQAQGKDVINLAIGEPDFNTPDIIKEYAKESIDQNYSHYPPVSGYLDLRQAICNKLKRDNNLDYEPNQIVVSNGAKHSIANVVMCLINKGDEVLIPTPYWVSYREIVKLADGIPTYIQATIENNYKITPEQLDAAITPNTKLIILNSPSNPSGIVYTKNELEAFAKIIVKHPNVFVLSDEIYELITFEEKFESIAQFEEIKDRVIIINGVSKSFAMTGWRIGYIVAPLNIAKACDKYQGHITSAPSSIAQRASIKAMEINPYSSPDVINMKNAFKERCELAIDELKKIKGFRVNKPLGALYLFPDIRSYFETTDGKNVITNSEEFCSYLLNEANVATVPGTAFGENNSIRISIATSKELLLKAINRIQAACSLLK